MPRPSASRSFVKPARAGSSVGVSKVHDASELAGALELAFAEDEKVLIETAIVGREVEVAILEGRGGGRRPGLASGRDRADDPRVLRLRGQVPRRRRRGGRVPGRSDRRRDRRGCSALGIRAFEAVDGRGLARVDFFLAARRALRQRAQHDARLHADLDVPEVLDRVGDDLRRAHLGAHRHRARARRGSGPRASRRPARCTPSRRWGAVPRCRDRASSTSALETTSVSRYSSTAGSRPKVVTR